MQAFAGPETREGFMGNLDTMVLTVITAFALPPLLLLLLLLIYPAVFF